LQFPSGREPGDTRADHQHRDAAHLRRRRKPAFAQAMAEGEAAAVQLARRQRRIALSRAGDERRAGGGGEEIAALHRCT
jgi:hypothetical protein